MIPAQTNKKGSLGIIVISIAEIFIGSYGTFLALRLINSYSKISKDLSPYYADKFAGTIPISIITLVFSCLIIFLGISIIRKQRASRLVHIALSPLIAIFIVNTIWGFVIQLISYLNIPALLNLSEFIIAGILIVAITIGYLFYLTRPKVKELFATNKGGRFLKGTK